MDLMLTPDEIGKRHAERCDEIERVARDEAQRAILDAQRDVRAAAAVPRTDYNADRVARVVLGTECGVTDRIRTILIDVNGLNTGGFPRTLGHRYDLDKALPLIEPGEYAVVVEIYRIATAAAKREDGDRSVTFTVNGQEQKVWATSASTLRELRAEALRLSHNHARPAADWSMYLADGKPVSEAALDLPIATLDLSEPLLLSLAVGYGGASTDEEVARMRRAAERALGVGRDRSAHLLEESDWASVKAPAPRGRKA